MARIQPSLSKAETELIDQVAELTQTKRTDVIKNALAVYHWFVKQTVLGATVVARKVSGEEITLQTPELAALEGKPGRMSAKELGALARKLAKASDKSTAERIKDRLTKGFYGV